MSNINNNNEYKWKTDDIYDDCCGEKDFKFESKEDEEAFYSYDYLDLGLGFSCIVEDYFFNKIILNYWQILKKISQNSICLINGFKFYFTVNPINSQFFEIILLNITNSPDVLYKYIKDKKDVLNTIDKLIYYTINFSLIFYKNYLYNILLFSPSSTIKLLQSVKCITGPTTFS